MILTTLIIWFILGVAFGLAERFKNVPNFIEIVQIAFCVIVVATFSIISHITLTHIEAICLYIVCGLSFFIGHNISE